MSLGRIFLTLSVGDERQSGFSTFNQLSLTKGVEIGAVTSASVGGARGEEGFSSGRQSVKPLVPGDATPLTGTEVSFSR